VEEPPVPVEKEAGWDPDPVWTKWRRKNFPASAENRTPRTPGSNIRLEKTA